MEEVLIPIAAILMVFGMPVMIVWIIMHYRHKQRAAEPVRPANAALGEVAERMERRIEALEKLLDAEAPGWRKRHAE